jgi:hypothetical protein
MTSAARARIAAAASIAAMLMLAGRTRAQVAPAEEGPIVVGRQEKLPPFSLAMPHGSLDFLGFYSQDHEKSSIAGSTDSDETTFEEALTLETTGHIIHPNLVDLHLKGTFGLTQDEFHSTDFDDKSNSTIYLWDAQANLFREQKISSMLYTSRTDQLVDRAFGPSLRDIYTVYGDLIQIRSQSMPTTFRLYRDEQEQQDLSGNQDYAYNENVFEWHTDAQPTEHQFLTWDYRALMSEQDSNGEIDNSTGQSASLGHSISFGPQYRYSLGSTVSYSSSSGDFGSDRFHWDELLHVNHTKNFETEYEYLMDKQDIQGTEQTYQRATADFEHRLYESLVSHGKLGYVQLDYSGGAATKDVFAQSDFTYTKRVPLGRLLGTMNLGYDVRSTDSIGDAIPVVDQPVTFNSFQPILVPGTTVIPGSVVIRNSTTNVPYTPGLDYTVTERPDGVRIDPVVGGAIPQGEPVLLNYVLGPQPESTLDTFQFSIGMRYDITRGLMRGFSPYARFGLVEQDVSGGDGLIIADSIRDYVVGADYHIGDITLTGEYEDYQSKIIPFTAVRLAARYDHNFSTDTQVTLNTSYTLLDYTKQGERTENYLASLSFAHRLTRELFIAGSANWIMVEDSLGGSTQGTQELLELRWRRRQLEFYARVRNSNLRGDETSSDFQFVQVGLSRKF